MSNVSFDIYTFHIDIIESKICLGILSQFLPIFWIKMKFYDILLLSKSPIKLTVYELFYY